MICDIKLFLYNILEPEIPDIIEEDENKEDTEIVAAQQNGDDGAAAAASPGADSKASPKGRSLGVSCQNLGLHYHSPDLALLCQCFS